MTYLVHINPTPGKDDRVVEVEADRFKVHEGHLMLCRDSDSTNSLYVSIAAFSPAVWNYVEPKK